MPGPAVGKWPCGLTRVRASEKSIASFGHNLPVGGPRGRRGAWYPSAMLDIGLQEMLVIAVIALLVFGPSKLPELGRMVGRTLREFRRASDDFRTTVETNLHINDPDPIIEPGPVPVAAAGPVTTETTPLPSELEPQAAEALGDAAPSSDVTEPYAAQRGFRLFHRRECVWVSRVPEIERVYFKQVAEARDQGFVECPVCEPWESA